MDMELKQAEMYDLIFLYLKINNNCDFSAIWNDNKAVLSKMGIDVEKLKIVLDSLVNDKKIALSPGLEYSLSPINVFFNGFHAELYKSRSVEKKSNNKSKWDLFLRIIPIVLSIVFGTAAIYFNVLNYEKDKQLDEKNHVIDSLNNVIKSNIPSGILLRPKHS